MADFQNAVASTKSARWIRQRRGIEMTVIVKEHVDSKPKSASNRVGVIVLLLSIACASALFASFFLPAENIVPAAESQLGP